MAEKINESIHLNGGWFFQVKQRADGTLVLLEIAPRIAGSSAIQRVRGVNLPLLSLYNQMQMPIQIEPQSFGVTVERAWSNRYRLDFQFNHVYVDFDDCLIQCGSVFPEMVRFLYQCINAGKSLHLLSRHAGNLTHRLQELRLASLFDTVTVVDRATPKSRYILQQDAIFIDDSFAERSEVHRTTGIPVFSIDALECLEC